MTMRSLRSSMIESDEYPEPLKNHNTNGNVARVVFVDLADALVAEIQQATYVVGCIAWLTHLRILDTLARKKGVSIILQKEDFLRPDAGGPTQETLRRKYDAITPTNGESFWDETNPNNLLARVNTCSPPEIGIRCCGVASQKGNARPRMHHKFAVFLNANFKPYRVWTGSYNWTNNAELSFENAVVLDDKSIVSAYFKEFQQIAALSEPLDWTSEYVQPEYRIGT